MLISMQWSEKYIFTYINSRLSQVMYTHFDTPFWDYGRFPLVACWLTCTTWCRTWVPLSAMT